MAEETGISWTDSTFNPWIGCQKISEGCRGCYASVSSPARVSRKAGIELWGPPSTTQRRRTSDDYWRGPLRWNREAAAKRARRKVFCASLADVFEDHPAVQPWRRELWALVERTEWLDWQLLTKRPENIERMIPRHWIGSPQHNVWIGTTVENNDVAQERIPVIQSIPAAVRFISCEPMLESIDFSVIRPAAGTGTAATKPGIDWLIFGGESGANARPFNVGWVEGAMPLLLAAGVSVFVKQLGAKPVEPRFLDGGFQVVPIVLDDPAGADPSEWPSRLVELQRRDFPVR